MVGVNVTRGNQNQLTQRYEVQGQTYREVQNNLATVGVPVGIFYYTNLGDAVPFTMVRSSQLDYPVGDLEVYYGTENSTLDNTDRLFENRYDLGQASALLAAGANPNLRDLFGETPLYYLAPNGLGITQALLAAGADPNIPDREGRTSLRWPIAFGRLDVVQALLAAGANPNTPSSSGLTALHQAVYEGDLDIVKALIEAGAVDTPDYRGETAVDLARSRGHEDIADYIQYGPPDIKEPEFG